MKYIGILKGKKLTIALLIVLLPLIVIEARTKSVSGYAFVGFAIPLILNLTFCLFDHIRKAKRINLARAGFIAFHASFLVIIVGGIITYFTYTIGYIELAEGQSFIDYKENYTAWRQKFGTRAGTGAAIFVKKIVLEFWGNGQIKEFKNEIRIKDGDKERDEVLKINGSLKYGGLLINMARYYGLAPYFTLVTPDGSRSGYVNIRHETKFNSFEIPMVRYKAHISYKDINDRQIAIKIFIDGKTMERVARAGDVIDLGQAQLELTRVDLWNGLTVVTDSGKGITYAGFGLFLLGLGLFYGKKLYGGAH